MLRRGGVAVVTGGQGALGAALRTRFEAAGLIVTSADLAGTGADVELDVTDPVAVQEAVDGLMEQHGRLEVVVINAGVASAGVLEDMPSEGWDRVLSVNLIGAVNVLRATYPLLVAGKRGHILIAASLAGLVPTPLLVPYATTKHALVGLGTSLRVEAARHGIGVTTLCPGPFESPFLDSGGTGGVVKGVDTRRLLVNTVGPPMTADAVAAAAIKGMERNRAIVAPGRAGVIWKLARYSPGLTARILARNMKAELTESS